MSPLQHYTKAQELLAYAGQQQLASTVHAAAVAEATAHALLAIAGQGQAVPMGKRP